jgi:GMP synthase-like glutamine amidotransferase
MILLLSVCSEPLHYFEFVKPIERILEENKIKFITRDYRKASNDEIINAEKVIICGTSLKDNEFLEHLDKFDWIKRYNKPVLGICAGMQIIALKCGAKLMKKQEIGLTDVIFDEDFFGLNGKARVYALHNSAVSPASLQEFDIIARSKTCVEAVRHKTRPLYGVLFHPEARNKFLIEEFVKY